MSPKCWFVQNDCTGTRIASLPFDNDCTKNSPIAKKGYQDVAVSDLAVGGKHVVLTLDLGFWWGKGIKDTYTRGYQQVLEITQVKEPEMSFYI
tara:strand:- start:64 stop:342 length:279 start_codon:yes stop_codon:yes gene_type:complete